MLGPASGGATLEAARAAGRLSSPKRADA